MIAKGSIVEIVLAGDNKSLLKTRQLQRHATACADYFLCVDWCNRSIFIMIGPGGLLLVVPTYLQPMFQSYGWGCRKVKN
jgi:hypothetical protein